jgi:hypothetical protein
MPSQTHVDREEKGTSERFVGSGFFGLDVFFDAKYVEADIGIYFQPSAGEGLETSLNFGLLGKYPFKANDRFTFFPLLGVDYKFMLVMIDEFGDSRGRGDTDFKYNRGDPDVTTGARHDEIWFKVGIGGDVTLSDRVYLRNELLWGVRLLNDWEKEGNAYATEGGRELSMFYHGVTYKLAVGFKLGRIR